MPHWMNHKLEINIAERNINNLRYVDTTLVAESEQELKILLMRVEKRQNKLV